MSPQPLDPEEFGYDEGEQVSTSLAAVIERAEIVALIEITAQKSDNSLIVDLRSLYKGRLSDRFQLTFFQGGWITKRPSVNVGELLWVWGKDPNLTTVTDTPGILGMERGRDVVSFNATVWPYIFEELRDDMIIRGNTTIYPWARFETVVKSLTQNQGQ